MRCEKKVETSIRTTVFVTGRASGTSSRISVLRVPRALASSSSARTSWCLCVTASEISFLMIAAASSDELRVRSETTEAIGIPRLTMELSNLRGSGIFQPSTVAGAFGPNLRTRVSNGFQPKDSADL